MVTVKTPDWVKDAVFYQIFPDRFSRSKTITGFKNIQPWGSKPTYNGFQGGNLPGITEKLNYLKDLGINAIYLNPIFQSASNHRYHTHDYYKIDPIVGDLESFKHLLDSAHKKGIRIILDGVFNHSSRGFFQFNHVLECGAESPYLDWFHVENFPLRPYESSRHPNYKSWAGHRALPVFNTDNEQVRKFILDAAAYWTNMGIDGWRLDVPAEIDDDEFWQAFRNVVKTINPDAYIVGEIWVNEVTETGARWLQGDQFDAIMNYGLLSACIAFFIGSVLDKKLIRDQGHAPKKVINAQEFASRIESILQLYHPEIVYSQYNLLSSHDTARFINLCRGDFRILKLTLTFLMTFPGTPSIYYGDEVGLEGARDPDCRRAMPWDKELWNLDVYSHTKKMISIRNNNQVFRRGIFNHIHVDKSAGVYAYSRSLNDTLAIVILNNSEKTYSVDIPVEEHLYDNALLKCLLHDNEYVVKNNRLTGSEVGPKDSAVLIVKQS